MFKTPKIRDRKHRKFIASLPCAICPRTDVQAAHVRKGNGGGMGLKPSDEFCVPLCVEHHQVQGEMGEVNFWFPFGGYQEATKLALRLYELTGNHDAALKEIARF